MKNIEEPIIVEQTFNASLENVWDAITVLDKMIKWFFPNISSFEPVVGFETGFVIQVEDRIFPHLWKLTEVIPMKKIAYEWKFEGYPGSAISLFELMEEHYQTKLKLTFTVVENFPDNIPEFKRESGVAGWNYFIKESLKEYLEKKI
ncbi:SRPBCC family protein [Flavivirga spongiicola]|uniref:SRPBCC domain-containing protein n=1 Tax=Flavivirga spongiicola TaxID=421621 RepID=A0ABU7XU83_9FLAO|nr:SRPBCC domain-containing protein [Flavivirga sp. MEBiC05379]MDO5979343.1 SRPBCC domain-containing protein [Flavivirga sp. MEBiC05379]